MERNCKTWSSKLQPKSRSHAQTTPAIRSGSPVPKKASRKLAMKSYSSLLSRWGQLRGWSVCTGLSPRATPSWFCPSQDKRAVERLEVEKAFHPFIAGPYNRLVGEIMQETGTRINIPPPSVNRTEIVFTGEKEQLAQAVARIKKIYEEKVAVGKSM